MEIDAALLELINISWHNSKIHVMSIDAKIELSLTSTVAHNILKIKILTTV